MLKDPLQLRASEKIIQFPFSVPVAEDKTEQVKNRKSISTISTFPRSLDVIWRRVDATERKGPAILIKHP